MPLAHITLATRDVMASAAFFESIFGWMPIPYPPNAPLLGAWLSIAPGQQLHLLDVPDFAPSAHEAEFGRHIALFHPQADMPGLRQRLEQRSIEFIDPIRSTPFERFFFKDPNGYMFEVINEDQYTIE